MFCKTKIEVFWGSGKIWSLILKSWYLFKNPSLLETVAPPTLWLSYYESVSPCCLRVGRWQGRLLFRAPPSAIPASFRDFSPRGKRAKFRSTLAPACLGLLFSGKHSVKETIDWKQTNSQLLRSPCREFRHNVRRCHHWTTNLGCQIMRKSSAKFQTADPSTRGSELANFSVTAVTARSRYVSCRLLRSTE